MIDHNTLFPTSKKQQESCPKCGGELLLRNGKKGLFLGCSNYPKCDYLKPLHNQEHRVLKVLDRQCPECGNNLVLRQGSYGMFIGCSNYPECHYIVHEHATEDHQEMIVDDIECPQCHQGQLIARRGRQGKIFYGCERFPKCRFTLAHKPYKKTCPYLSIPSCL